jgi:hypothetical protein
MGLDLDCSNFKAIDEMVLFAFSFAAQVEKEMIQERTRNGLESIKANIATHGYHITRKTKRKITHLGGNSDMTQARMQSAKNRRERALANPTNLFFKKYVSQFEERNGKLNPKDAKAYTQLANELNGLGQKTATGLPYTKNRCQALVIKMRKLYNG